MGNSLLKFREVRFQVNFVRGDKISIMIIISLISSTNPSIFCKPLIKIVYTIINKKETAKLSSKRLKTFSCSHRLILVKEESRSSLLETTVRVVLAIISTGFHQMMSIKQGLCTFLTLNHSYIDIMLDYVLLS